MLLSLVIENSSQLHHRVAVVGKHAQQSWCA